MPVSSTHIAVGAVFGVGFLREFIANYGKSKLMKGATGNNVSSMNVAPSPTIFEKTVKRKLVRRRHLMTIVAAWVITVPSAAILSGLIFFGLVTLF